MASERGARRGRSTSGLMVLVVVAVGIVAWAVAASPLFGVRRVHVVGNISVPTDDVVRLSGIGHGDNLFALTPGRVEERIRRSPWVADVAVERSFPSTVVLRITERRAVATVDDPQGLVLLAADGTALGRGGAADARLPSIGTWPDRLAVGSRLAEHGPALRVAASFPPALRRAVAAVALSEGEVLLRLRPRGRVLYGADSSFGPKNQAILSMLRWAKEREVIVGHIDVRVPQSPALRPAPEQAPEAVPDRAAEETATG